MYLDHSHLRTNVITITFGLYVVVDIQVGCYTHTHTALLPINSRPVERYVSRHEVYFLGNKSRFLKLRVHTTVLALYQTSEQLAWSRTLTESTG